MINWKKSSFSNGSSACVEVAHDSDWWKSSFCKPYENCVEVSTGEHVILVRNSRDKDGPVLAYTRAEWDAFIKGAKAGEFDLS